MDSAFASIASCCGFSDTTCELRRWRMLAKYMCLHIDSIILVAAYHWSNCTVVNRKRAIAGSTYHNCVAIREASAIKDCICIHLWLLPDEVARSDMTP